VAPGRRRRRHGLTAGRLGAAGPVPPVYGAGRPISPLLVGVCNLIAIFAARRLAASVPGLQRCPDTAFT
jgi:hypothetical protein